MESKGTHPLRGDASVERRRIANSSGGEVSVSLRYARTKLRSRPIHPSTFGFMETSLHKTLKQMYAGETAETEVTLGRFRIDAVVEGRLFEVQCAGLSSIRDKIRTLCKKHQVTVVKPVIARRRLIKLAKQDGKEVSRRYSPKKCDWLDLFDQLVHFTKAFPHPNLTLEVPLVEIAEIRYPGHGKRRRWRKNDHVVADQTLTEILETRTFRETSDLWTLLPGLPPLFTTADLAALTGRTRWYAQKIAYCLRETGAAEVQGKKGNALLYQAAVTRAA